MQTPFRFLFTILAAACLLSGCGLFGSDAHVEQPINDELALKENHGGSLTGGAGLFSLGGSGTKNGNGGGIGVNSFLWRGSLDTLAFMPLTSADPFGGVIITDWYEDPKARGERYKVNVLILDKTMRADGVKVTLFKQVLDSHGAWRDEAVNPRVARDLEDTILTRARQLRLSQAK